MMKRLLWAALALLCAGQVNSAALPQSCGKDNRVRCVDYDEYDVTVITASFGYQTSIFFDQGEEIIDLGGGDTEAWQIGVLEQKHGLFIKPSSSLPATNISIVTNKRVYHFDFHVSKSNKAEDRIYAVKFRYPAKVSKEAVAEKNTKDIESALTFAHVAKPKNEDYWIEGSDAISPIAAWDDGENTYLRFSPRTLIPAIYIQEEDGTERIAQRHSPERNTVMIPMVAKKIVLRRDNLIACIYNESYDKYGVETPTMTVSPFVTRSLKGGIQSQGPQINGDVMPSVDSLLKPPPAPAAAPTRSIDLGASAR